MDEKDFPNSSALDLIKIAVQSGSIKLSGSTTSTDEHSARLYAAKDAAYLRALFAKLVGGRAE